MIRSIWARMRSCIMRHYRACWTIAFAVWVVGVGLVAVGRQDAGVALIGGAGAAMLFLHWVGGGSLIPEGGDPLLP
jgi:hypothetical protein